MVSKGFKRLAVRLHQQTLKGHEGYGSFDDRRGSYDQGGFLRPTCGALSGSCVEAGASRARFLARGARGVPRRTRGPDGRRRTRQLWCVPVRVGGPLFGAHPKRTPANCRPYLGKPPKCWRRSTSAAALSRARGRLPPASPRPPASYGALRREHADLLECSADV
jgi:hypothetical protein